MHLLVVVKIAINCQMRNREKILIVASCTLTKTIPESQAKPSVKQIGGQGALLSCLHNFFMLGLMSHATVNKAADPTGKDDFT